MVETLLVIMIVAPIVLVNVYGVTLTHPVGQPAGELPLAEMAFMVAAGLVGQGRLVLFYAATATLSMLSEQTWRTIHSDFEVADFFQAGLFSAACFGVAISARLLGLRILAHEEVARQRGIDLKIIPFDNAGF